MEQSTPTINQEQEMISNFDLSSIYKQISIEPDNDFDESNESIFLEQCIEKCFDSEFKLIETDTLINDINLLNLNFAKLIHYCNNNYKYKNVSKIFIAYCDYFSLDFHTTYIRLHEKLQTLIRSGFIRLIGGIKKFTKIKNKLDPSTITTLFDLISK